MRNLCFQIMQGELWKYGFNMVQTAQLNLITTVEINGVFSHFAAQSATKCPSKAERHLAAHCETTAL